MFRWQSRAKPAHVLPSYALEGQPQLKDSSAYRQLRPTKLDKIKNLFHHIHSGGVIGLSPELPGG